MPRPRIVDVRDLEPPQPMQLALAALRELAADEFLLLRHRHAPVPLCAMLAGLGFVHVTRRGAEAPIEVWIWRQGTTPPEGCA